MKEVKLSHPPFVIEYHEDWEQVIEQLVNYYEEVAPWLLRDRCSPVPEKFFVQLRSSLTDKRVCICGIDPYPRDATGVPFESPNFNKKTIKAIANSVSRLTGINDFKNYNLIKIEGVLAWNYYLSCREGETKSHTIYWDRISRLLIQHISKFVRILYCLGRTDFSNIKTKIDSPLSVIVGYHPAARDRQFEKEKTFEIINILLELDNKETIDWSQGFSF